MIADVAPESQWSQHGHNYIGVANAPKVLAISWHICFVWDCRAYWWLNASWNSPARCHGSIRSLRGYCGFHVLIQFMCSEQLSLRGAGAFNLNQTKYRFSTHSVGETKQEARSWMHEFFDQWTVSSGTVLQLLEILQFNQIVKPCEAYQNYTCSKVSANVPPQVWCWKW